MNRFYQVILFASLCLPGLGQSYRVQVSAITAMQSGLVAPTPTKWYVRKGGGTRFSANVPTGQCDGQADLDYPGTGVNQHCAYGQFRYLWDDKSGLVGSGKWVIAGGDTVTVRDGPWRLGWDGPTGQTSGNWCYGVGSYTCYNPPIPAGTAAMHTRILGENYASCNVGGATNPKLYASNLTQLFGGFSLVETFNLQDTQYVDVQCIELTTHNGKCTVAGYPSFPRGCSNNQPLDDYAQNGFLTNNASAKINLQDVYVHGFNDAGFFGPIGGIITMNRVFSGFNGKVGWQFDDGHDTPDAPGSQILAHYATMIGNGCYEEYPVKHAFPAQACYDDNSGGFGDAWSGQDTILDTFVCDHCWMQYNTKDAFIGPHTQVQHLTITNSFSGSNGGAQWKWGAASGADVTFGNNLTVMNCTRMSMPVPGATQNFALASKLPGANLSDFCRAGGDGMSFMTRPGSTNNFYGNTFVAANQTMMDLSCAYVDATGEHYETGCPALVWTNNNFLGFIGPANGGQAPGLWYFNPNSTIAVQSTYNNEFGVRNGDACGTNHNSCADPLQVAEPPQPWTTEAALDVFDPSLAGNSFYLAPNSPLLGKGTAISGRTTDFSGATLPTPPPIGALALAVAAPTPTPAPIPTPVPVQVWTKVANEGDVVNVPAGTTVRYGFGAKWIAPKLFASAATFTASNTFFAGDPFPNQAKEVDALGTGAGITTGVVPPPAQPPAPPVAPSVTCTKAIVLTPTANGLVLTGCR